jgi:hypothetical protein
MHVQARYFVLMTCIDLQPMTTSFGGTCERIPVAGMLVDGNSSLA